jgi:hypothetical protein
VILANFLFKVEIPDWMSEAEQDAMLEALDNINFKSVLQSSAVKTLERWKRFAHSDVKVED